MGCFIACFGGSRGRKGRRSTPKGLPRNINYECQESPPLLKSLTPSLKPTIEEIGQGGSFSEPREKPEKTEVVISRSPKKVTFDLQVKTYSEVPSHEEAEFLSEEESEGDHANELEEGNESPSLTSSEDHSTSSTTCSFSTSHRYQHCRYSEDEDEDDNIDDDVLSDDDLSDDDVADDEHEDLFEWYSSSSFESESKSISPPPAKTEETNELITRPSVAVSRVRDRSKYVHPVLNAVENQSQWQALKNKETKNAPVIKERKENVPCRQETEFRFSLDQRQKPRVDASLSSWLVPSQPANYAASPVTISVKSKDDAFNTIKTETKSVLVALTNGRTAGSPPYCAPPNQDKKF